MMTATTVVRSVRESAEAIRNDETQVFPEAASPGDCVRQGDVYIVLLDAVPSGAKPVPVRMQLAPGTTTGSRHCLDSSQGVEMFELAESSVLDGPVLRLSELRTITHPEHGDWVLSPRRVYGIEYQRDLAEEERRVQD